MLPALSEEKGNGMRKMALLAVLLSFIAGTSACPSRTDAPGSPDNPIRSALMGFYNVTGFGLASGAEYDGVQRALRELGKSVDEVIPGSVSFYKTRISPLLDN